MSTLHLNEWVTRLGNEEIPTFANTARRMAAISCDNESSANDLAKVILHDSAMTARVLRLVNSAFYNPNARKLDTVSYAIVVLGFEKVRNLALTVSMLESSVTSDMLEHVKQEMACAYHAAIQAQRLAEKTGLKDTENIYIAALLHRLGQLMFWCFPYEYSDQLEKLSDDPAAYEKVEKEMLGFSLRQLTDSLITEWNLSPLLHDALTNQTFRDQKKACILHGFNIADCAKFSWENADANRQIRAISAFINMDFDSTRKWLLQNAKSAEKGLHEMGLCDKTSKSFIAAPKEAKQEPVKKQRKVIGLFDKAPFEKESRFEKQGRLIRQLTHLLNEELDLNHFLFTLLEGIQTAIECDQSFILLYKGKTREPVLKQHLGNLSGPLAKNAIKQLNDSNSLLNEALDPQEAIWSDHNMRLQALDGKEFVNRNLMVAPINAMGKHLGYIFSIKTGSQELSPRDFDSFRHFCDHASIAFRMFIKDKA